MSLMWEWMSFKKKEKKEDSPECNHIDPTKCRYWSGTIVKCNHQSEDNECANKTRKKDLEEKKKREEKENEESSN